VCCRYRSRLCRRYDHVRDEPFYLGEDYVKNDYHEGPEALKRFEDGMKKLFQAPKPTKSPFKPPAKQKKTSKD